MYLKHNALFCLHYSALKYVYPVLNFFGGNIYFSYPKYDIENSLKAKQ